MIRNYTSLKQLLDFPNEYDIDSLQALVDDSTFRGDYDHIFGTLPHDAPLDPHFRKDKYFGRVYSYNSYRYDTIDGDVVDYLLQASTLCVPGIGVKHIRLLPSFVDVGVFDGLLANFSSYYLPKALALVRNDSLCNNHLLRWLVLLNQFAAFIGSTNRISLTDAFRVEALSKRDDTDPACPLFDRYDKSLLDLRCTRSAGVQMAVAELEPALPLVDPSKVYTTLTAMEVDTVALGVFDESAVEIVSHTGWFDVAVGSEISVDLGQIVGKDDKFAWELLADCVIKHSGIKPDDVLPGIVHGIVGDGEIDIKRKCVDEQAYDRRCFYDVSHGLIGAVPSDGDYWLVAGIVEAMALFFKTGFGMMNIIFSGSCKTSMLYAIQKFGPLRLLCQSSSFVSVPVFPGVDVKFLDRSFGVRQAVIPAHVVDCRMGRNKKSTWRKLCGVVDGSVAVIMESKAPILYGTFQNDMAFTSHLVSRGKKCVRSILKRWVRLDHPPDVLICRVVGVPDDEYSLDLAGILSYYRNVRCFKPVTDPGCTDGFVVVCRNLLDLEFGQKRNFKTFASRIRGYACSVVSKICLTQPHIRVRKIRKVGDAVLGVGPIYGKTPAYTFPFPRRDTVCSIGGSTYSDAFCSELSNILIGFKYPATYHQVCVAAGNSSVFKDRIGNCKGVSIVVSALLTLLLKKNKMTILFSPYSPDLWFSLYVASDNCYGINVIHWLLSAMENRWQYMVDYLRQCGVKTGLENRSALFEYIVRGAPNNHERFFSLFLEMKSRGWYFNVYDFTVDSSDRVVVR